MRLSTATPVLIVAWLAAVTDVRADVTARGDRHRPCRQRDRTLARDQSLYVRIEYATDKPVSIWARPYFNGRKSARNRTPRFLTMGGREHSAGSRSTSQVRSTI